MDLPTTDPRYLVMRRRMRELQQEGFDADVAQEIATDTVLAQPEIEREARVRQAMLYDELRTESSWSALRSELDAVNISYRITRKNGLRATVPDVTTLMRLYYERVFPQFLDATVDEPFPNLLRVLEESLENRLSYGVPHRQHILAMTLKNAVIRMQEELAKLARQR